MPTQVMIVDDDEIMLTLLIYNFQAAGYDVEGVGRGDDAVRRLTVAIPQLLVLDWMLPGLSGIEICRRVRKTWSPEHLPILMLSARRDAADRDYAHLLGVDEYVQKPFVMRELLVTAHKLIMRQRELVAV